MKESQESVETGDYFGDYVVKNVTEYFDYILPNQRPVFESYLKGRRDFHMHFRIGDEEPTWDSGEYCLAFHCAQDENLKFSTLPALVLGNEHICRESKSGKVPSCEVEHSVLVNIRKFIEFPERMGTKIPPALIRLQPLYNCLRFWVDRLEHLRSVVPKHPGARPGNSLARFIPDDRELSLACNLFRQGVGMGNRETIGQMVESASEILNDIPENKRKWIDRDWIDTGLDEEMGRIIWIGIKSGRIQVFFEPLVKSDIQIIQVFPRSFDLEDVRRFWGAHNGCSFFAYSEECQQPSPKSAKTVKQCV